MNTRLFLLELKMSFLNMFGNLAKGALTGVAIVTALPFFGVAGAITATGAVVGAAVGAGAALVDSIVDSKEES
jgi:hypothetical protein